MKREVCPSCGGVLVAESLGWKCKSCRGFISLQDGKFYEYVEKPFMPPKTNADRIRAMSDEELEQAFYGGGLCSYIQGHDQQWCDDMPYCGNCVIQWLRQPVKEDKR